MKSRILHLYGEETARHIRVFKKLRFRRGNSVPKRRHIKFRSRGISRRKHTTFRTWRKFEIKNTSSLWGGNCKTHSSIQKTPFQKKEQCTETSAYKIQKPGNYSEESIQHSEHGESLKSRILHLYGEESARNISLFEKLRFRRRNRQTSETSAYKIQTSGNYPEESIQHSEHGESLKSRILCDVYISIFQGTD